MATTDPKIAALIARAHTETPAWRKELMHLIKKSNLTKTETARLIELSKRQAAASKAR